MQAFLEAILKTGNQTQIVCFFMRTFEKTFENFFRNIYQKKQIYEKYGLFN